MFGAPDDAIDVSKNNRVYDNIINTQGSECVEIKEHSTANIVERNQCTGEKDTESAGLDSRGDGNIFRANTVYGNKGAGIRFGGDTTNDGIDNDAYANTIKNNERGGIKFQRIPQRKSVGTPCREISAGARSGPTVLLQSHSALLSHRPASTVAHYCVTAKSRSLRLTMPLRPRLRGSLLRGRWLLEGWVPSHDGRSRGMAPAKC
jgi:hypothetical protein